MLCPEIKIAESGRKKYSQVADIVEEMIRKKVFESGSRLPGDRKLAEMLKVTPVTVNKGLNELAARGIITRTVGAGSYVRGEEKKQRNFRIGIFIHVQPVMGDWYVSNVINHFNDLWKKSASEVIMQIKTPPEYRKAIDENKLDGVMVLAPEESFVPHIAALRNEGLPVVSIGCFSDKLPGVSFGTDHLAAAKRAVEYLASLSYRNIGVLLPAYSAWPFSLRLEGYNAGMWDAGLPVNPEWIIKISDSDSIADILAEKKKKRLLPDAFLLASSWFYLPFYTALQNIGLRMPDDISAIGFDDTPDASALPVPMTVFAQPLDKVVGSAADALLNMIKNCGSKQEGRFVPELVIRNSCRTLK